MKQRIIIGLVALVAAVGTVAGLQPDEAGAAVKSAPTGNSQLDAICQQFADEINRAIYEGDRAVLNGDQATADAWYDVAAYGARRAADSGCNLFLGIRATTQNTLQPAPTIGSWTIVNQPAVKTVRLAAR